MTVRGYTIAPGANLTGAYLTGAHLSGANLTGADLYRADLTGATLTGANLARANLTGADLYRADLTGANLARANLTEADLTGAYLTGAYLTRANLHGANMPRANLHGAILDGTVLDPAAPLPAVTDNELIDAGFTIRGTRVYGYRTKFSQHVGSTLYEPGKTYTAPYFSIDTSSDCHPGIYLAGKKWLGKHYPAAELVRVSCARADILHADEKWRAKKIRVLASE